MNVKQIAEQLFTQKGILVWSRTSFFGDEYLTTTSGSTVSFMRDSIKIETGEDTSYYAVMGKVIDINPVFNTISKMVQNVVLRHTMPGTKYFLGIGASINIDLSDTNNKVGFMLVGGKLYAVCANGSNSTAVELAFLPENYEVYETKIEWYPGSKAIFYINGEKVAEITTNVPTANNNTIDYVFKIRAKTEDGNNKYIYIYKIGVIAYE